VLWIVGGWSVWAPLRGALAVATAGLALLAWAACSAAAGPVAPAGRGSTASPTALPTTVDGFFGAELHRADHGAFGLAQLAILPGDDPRIPAVLRVSSPADSASQLSAATADTPHGGAQAYLAWSGGPARRLRRIRRLRRLRTALLTDLRAQLWLTARPKMTTCPYASAASPLSVLDWV
jgi:hypothetical protein